MRVGINRPIFFTDGNETLISHGAIRLTSCMDCLPSLILATTEHMSSHNIDTIHSFALRPPPLTHTQVYSEELQYTIECPQICRTQDGTQHIN